MEGTLHVRGFRPFMAACAKAQPVSRKQVRQALRRSGEVVRTDAQRRFDPIDRRSAAGYKVGVTQKRVTVYQSLRRTTGKHPEYGRLQMRRALLPAAYSNMDETERALERALDDVAATFNRGG